MSDKPTPKNLEIGAAYIRVSTDDQAELSPDAQIRVIMETAKADGYIIPKEFIFEEKKGISGREADNRPEFLRSLHPSNGCTCGNFPGLPATRKKAPFTKGSCAKNAAWRSKAYLNLLQTACLAD